MYSDPAWDEYMSTGIDPTGGDLGPDFDPETGEYLDDDNDTSESHQPHNPFKHAFDDKAFAGIDSGDKKKGNTRSPQYLFFDTETTGLPYYDFISAEEDASNWPRLVQLSWIMTDSEGNITKEMNKFVIPEGFYIPEDATRIHGITTEYADYWGERLERVLHVFNKSLRKAEFIICHNTWFDTNVILGEMKRMRIKTPLMEKKSYCTMLAGTDLCALEWSLFRGYKWPTLQELHRYLFRNGFSNAHDALADVKAAAIAYLEKSIEQLRERLRIKELRKTY